MSKTADSKLKQTKALKHELQNELQYIESVEEILRKEDEKGEMSKIRKKLSS